MRISLTAASEILQPFTKSLVWTINNQSIPDTWRVDYFLMVPTLWMFSWCIIFLCMWPMKAVSTSCQVMKLKHGRDHRKWMELMAWRETGTEKFHPKTHEKISTCSCNCCQGIKASSKDFVVLGPLLKGDFLHKGSIMQTYYGFVFVSLGNPLNRQPSETRRMNNNMVSAEWCICNTHL